MASRTGAALRCGTDPTTPWARISARLVRLNDDGRLVAAGQLEEAPRELQRPLGQVQGVHGRELQVEETYAQQKQRRRGSSRPKRLPTPTFSKTLRCSEQVVRFGRAALAIVSGAPSSMRRAHTSRPFAPGPSSAMAAKSFGASCGSWSSSAGSVAMAEERRGQKMRRVRMGVWGTAESYERRVGVYRSPFL